MPAWECGKMSPFVMLRVTPYEYGVDLLQIQNSSW